MNHDELVARINTFLDTIPAALDGVDGLVPRAKAYRTALHTAGLAGLDVPTEYGGAGLDGAAVATFSSLTRGKLPPEADLFLIGLGMAIPTVLDHGSEELKKRYVEPALRGEEIWCQMYSEPGAGSDLAGMQTRATRTDEGWVLNGQKVWTSRAVESQFAICLARTNPDVPKHKGITMFVLPLEQPGVTIRPIQQITGVSEFNEIFLDNALVPADHVVGEVDAGWRVAVALLMKERQSIGSGGGRQPVAFPALLDLVDTSDLRDDPAVRAQLADCWIGQRLANLFDEHQAQLVHAGEPLGARTSMGKLWRSENGRRATSLVSRVAYAGGTSWSPGDDRDQWTFAVLDSCALSIGGGTDEVMKNGLAEQVLGLPVTRSPTTRCPSATFASAPRLPEVTSMNLLPTFEQTSLAEALRDVLVDGSDDATVWRALSQDLGVAGIGIHEEHGGAGGSLADLSIVFTELGRAVAQDRLLPHVIGLRLLLGAGESGSDLLAQALAGDAVIAWSPRPASIQFDPTSGTATGTAAGVLGDADASVFLVPVDGPDGVAILAVAAGAPGLQVTAQTGLDLRRPEVRVDLANAPARALGNPELFAAIEPVAAVLLAASQLGAPPAASRTRSTTPRTATSSAAPSDPSRRSSTDWPTPSSNCTAPRSRCAVPPTWSEPMLRRPSR